MDKVNAKICMTSVTFRRKNPDEILREAVKNRLDGIEWGGDVHIKSGDLITAAEVGKKTVDCGLFVSSYGSYFTVDPENANLTEFGETVGTALALGTRVIRIWAPRIASSDADEKTFDGCVKSLQAIGNRAAADGATVCLEFHNGTMNDCGPASRKLLEAVGMKNVRTYWQPLYDPKRNLRDIAIIKDYVENVHVYKWIYGETIERKLLGRAEDEWRKYVAALGNRNYILEFTRGDDEKNFAADTETLRKILEDYD